MIKLWKLGTSVIFFTLASLLSYFTDPPFSACQQESLQGSMLRRLPTCSASTPWTSGCADLCRPLPYIRGRNVGAHLLPEGQLVPQ